MDETWAGSYLWLLFLGRFLPCPHQWYPSAFQPCIQRWGWYRSQAVFSLSSAPQGTAVCAVERFVSRGFVDHVYCTCVALYRCQRRLEKCTQPSAQNGEVCDGSLPPWEFTPQAGTGLGRLPPAPPRRTQRSFSRRCIFNLGAAIKAPRVFQLIRCPRERSSLAGRWAGRSRRWDFTFFSLGTGALLYFCASSSRGAQVWHLPNVLSTLAGSEAPGLVSIGQSELIRVTVSPGSVTVSGVRRP